MGMNTYRHQWGRGPSATYWRRRFLALVGGLAIFALLAWALSGALAGIKVVSPAANVLASSGHGRGGNSTRPGTGAPSSPRPSASGAARTSTPRPAATGSHRPSVPAWAAPPARGAAGGPRPCTPSRVVISLFASQVSYSAQAWPQFNVDVVSTADRPCTFNVGATRLALVINEGNVRVWSSADCAEGRKSLVTDLVKGVPTVLPISWDRRISSPGCELASSTVPAGIYTATASNGQLTSNTEIFRLR